MNAGTVLVALSSVARRTCGFGVGFCGLFMPGLLPPTAGCAWHWAQLLPLKVGPRPDPASPGILPETESTSLKRASACVKKDFSFALSDGYAPPAPADPPRGPGSV